jgi:hypothetical protein
LPFSLKKLSFFLALELPVFRRGRGLFFITRFFFSVLALQHVDVLLSGQLFLQRRSRGSSPLSSSPERI